MLVKRLADCPEITAGDGTRLRELIHPDRDPVDCRYSLALARLGPGLSSRPHRLEQSEVYWLIRGRGLMHVGGETRRVEIGDAVHIPAGTVQWLENDGPDEIEFGCIVDPAWTVQGETVLSPGEDALTGNPRSAAG